ncbi:MAG: asparagine synthase (glutamine-hydrolyzing) [Deltaproteobacteria bacterium]|nr:asparagine synthase (glutamine-hydrolyzing) [Deltaproteobacteria bacterium]
MCGICGKINFHNEPVDETLLKRMASIIAHRGPDDEGIYVKGSVGLGHRRLSIIDLSPLAHQPMSNEDGSVWIVFNGEIYNFIDLKKDLIKRGHTFRSHSDTEVILHLYEEEGTECVQKLRGMFAFAIWDERDKSLFLARDRVGKKPLYYRHANSAFVFASEIKAILQDTAFQRKPDYLAIHHYLTYQDVPSPWTAFEGINKLPPAHCLILKNGHVDMKRYWKLSYLPKHEIGIEEIKSEIIERLKEAITIRLISDVPLGAFLSGGIDSSATVALMAGMVNEPVKTFSIGFKEEAYNELRYARMVAERYKTDHTEFIVEPKAMEVIDKLVWHYNEPFADSSAIPTYYVSKLAREHVTVVLNGDGGDENFAGYGRYAANEFSRKIHRFFPTPIAKALLPLVMILPHGKDPKNFFWRLKRFLQEYVKSPEIRNAHWLCHFSMEMKSELYTDGFTDKVSGIDSFELLFDKYKEVEAESFLDKTLYADVMMYLPDDLLVKVDVASMANSLEARSPFLDHEFMEFAARIPSELKLKGRTTKYILKEALRGILPDDVLFRSKMGFGVPIDHWFRNELKEMAYDMLLGKRCVERGYFQKGFIQKILDEHVSGRWNWQYHIWNLLMLELWHREFIDTENLQYKKVWV